jgi:hypothetical protein
MSPIRTDFLFWYSEIEVIRAIGCGTDCGARGSASFRCRRTFLRYRYRWQEGRIRTQIVERICELVSPPGIRRVINARDGWPGLVEMLMPSGSVARVGLHVSQVSSHSRAVHEMRFQNPAAATPVRNRKGYFPVLVGLENRAPPILVALSAISRIGRARRFSILFDRGLLDEARRRGWAVYTSSTDEQIFAFKPALLPVFIEMQLQSIDGISANSFSDAIADVAEASGLLVDDSEEARARVRRTTDVLTRHYAFGRQVVAAYGGECSMCGLGSGLVVGAHIYPVSASGSKDVLWNGLALCPNHHAAFDAHRIYVHPDSKDILIHPVLRDAQKKNSALAAFISTTTSFLRSPRVLAARPRKLMFDRRYEHYETRYAWVT